MIQVFFPGYFMSLVFVFSQGLIKSLEFVFTWVLFSYTFGCFFFLVFSLCTLKLWLFLRLLYGVGTFLKNLSYLVVFV